MFVTTNPLIIHLHLNLGAGLALAWPGRSHMMILWKAIPAVNGANLGCFCVYMGEMCSGVIIGIRLIVGEFWASGRIFCLGVWFSFERGIQNLLRIL